MLRHCFAASPAYPQQPGQIPNTLLVYTLVVNRFIFVLFHLEERGSQQIERHVFPDACRAFPLKPHHQGYFQITHFHYGNRGGGGAGRHRGRYDDQFVRYLLIVLGGISRFRCVNFIDSLPGLIGTPTCHLYAYKAEI